MSSTVVCGDEGVGDVVGVELKVVGGVQTVVRSGGLTDMLSLGMLVMLVVNDGLICSDFHSLLSNLTL